MNFIISFYKFLNSLDNKNRLRYKINIQILHTFLAWNISRKGSNRSVRMKVRDIVKLIEADGWYWIDTKGSHRQYKHPTKPGRVTIAGHPNDDLAPGTLNSILKQAKLKEVK